MQTMIVLIRFAGRTLGLPLDQLDAVTGGKAAREAMADWRYGCAMGYVFGRHTAWADVTTRKAGVL